MYNLESYAKHFNEAYPDYSDERYQEVANLVQRYNTAKVGRALRSSKFAESVALIEPLIALKNFKSQIPFPFDVTEVVSCMVEIRRTKVRRSAPLANHEQLFFRILSCQGFQLPTVSAVFHFAHPRHFPIVDVNVAAACKVLKHKFPSDFRELKAPGLPAASTSPENICRKYTAFIAFIQKVITLQRAHTTEVTYRSVDKALMVIGKHAIKRASEAKGRS